MTFATFDALSQRLIELFQNQEFAAALELVTREGPRFPADRPLADYWRMCAAARVEQRQLVYQIAEQALADGLWYGQTVWRASPSFKPLQDDPAFERLVTASRAAEAAAATAPIMLTHLPAGHSAAPPLLLALHGNQRTAAATLPFWQAAVTAGWALAVPQSTQAMFTGAYVWDDLAQAQADVQARFAELRERLAFDAGRVVLAGHSMGGLIAIQMALTGALPVRGFVVNGPAVPFLEEPQALQAALGPARERGLRGYFIVGAQDDAINVVEIRALADQLRAAGLAVEVETVPEATHDYTPAYAAALLRGLEFVGAG